jgi:hypothetical protein
VRRAAVSALLAVLAVSLGAPAVALAQSGVSSPFSPGLPQSTPSLTTTTPTVSTTTTSTDSGLSGSGIAAIAIGALVVLGGISFFIWRDARKRAPIRRAAAAQDGIDGRSRVGSKAKTKPRKLSPAERKRRKRGRAR